MMTNLLGLKAAITKVLNPSVNSFGFFIPPTPQSFHLTPGLNYGFFMTRINFSIDKSHCFKLLLKVYLSNA